METGLRLTVKKADWLYFDMLNTKLACGRKSGDNTVLCRNLSTGKEQEAHPLDVYFAELIRYAFKQLFGVACFLLSCHDMQRRLHPDVGTRIYSQMSSLCRFVIKHPLRTFR